MQRPKIRLRGDQVTNAGVEMSIAYELCDSSRPGTDEMPPDTTLVVKSKPRLDRQVRKRIVHLGCVHS